MRKIKSFDNISRNLYVGLTLLLAGLSIGAYTIAFQQIPDPNTVNEKTLTGIGVPLAILSIIILIIGVIFIGNWDSRRKYTQGVKSKHIQNLTQTLKQAESAINVIRSEIEYGSRILDNIKTRASFQKRLSSLTVKQTEAIQFALQEELRKEGKRSIKKDIALVFLGTILGVIGSKLFN